MPKQPWEVPDPPKNGDPSIDSTFQAVGEALSKWEYFEGNLSLTFSYLVNSGFGNLAALRAYGSVESFRGRTNLLEHAAEVYFKYKPHEHLRKLLESLLKDANSRYSARRNEIAHGIVQQYFVEENNTMTFKGFVQYPAYYATRKRHLPEIGFPLLDTKPNYIYSSIEIRHFSSEFEKLANRAIDILTLLAQHDQIVQQMGSAQ